MKCKEIIRRIEKDCPPGAALDFDNVGLLAGRAEKEVNRIYLALDATTEVIAHACECGADMLITHHPLIFNPLKRVTDEDYVGRRILKLIQQDISYYAMHTNYDVFGMAQSAQEVLGLENARPLDVTYHADGTEEGIGRVGTLAEEMSLEECCAYVKERLKLDTVKVFGNPAHRIRTLAVSPGAGKREVYPAICQGAEVLVTGDIGHHEGMDAWEQGLAVIDAGHYGTEYLFMEHMKKKLSEWEEKPEVFTEPFGLPYRLV